MIQGFPKNILKDWSIHKKILNFLGFMELDKSTRKVSWISENENLKGSWFSEKKNKKRIEKNILRSTCISKRQISQKKLFERLGDLIKFRSIGTFPKKEKKNFKDFRI